MLVEVGDDMGSMVEAVDNVVDDAEMNVSFANIEAFFLKTGYSSLGSRVN